MLFSFLSSHINANVLNSMCTFKLFNSFRASYSERFDGRRGKNICVNIWDSFIHRQTLINSERITFEHVGIDKRNLNHSMDRNTSVYLHFKASLYVKQPD